jgi:hypothetical protein
MCRRLDREDETSAIEGERNFPDCSVGVRLGRKDLSARKGAEAAAMTGDKRPGPHTLAGWAGRLNYEGRPWGLAHACHSIRRLD